MTQTYGQDWNDALYALANIESRFHDDSHIEHGNTLTEDKFSHVKAHVVVANPPYGVSGRAIKKRSSTTRRSASNTCLQFLTASCCSPST